jgi:hypothetical protein
VAYQAETNRLRGRGKGKAKGRKEGGKTGNSSQIKIDHHIFILIFNKYATLLLRIYCILAEYTINKSSFEEKLWLQKEKFSHHFQDIKELFLIEISASISLHAR